MRAQKLMQGSNATLETYWRQVRTRDEQFAYSDSLYVPAFRALCKLFYACLDRNSLTSLQSHAAEQAETLHSSERTAVIARAAARRRRSGSVRGTACSQGSTGARAGTAARFA